MIKHNTLALRIKAALFVGMIIIFSLLVSSSQARTRDATVNKAVSLLDAFSMLPVIRSVSVSGDGKKLAILRATSKLGNYIIEIRNPFDLTKKPITFDVSNVQVSRVVWLNNEKLGVVFRQRLQKGSKKYWVNRFAIINKNGKGGWLVLFKRNKNVGFQLISLLYKNRNEILVETDIGENRIHNVVRFNVNTGRSVVVFKGNTNVNGGFIADIDGEIRAGSGWDTKEGTIDLFAREKGSKKWQLVKQNSSKNREIFTFLHFSKKNPNEIYVKANLGEDKAGIYLYNIKTATYSERLFGLKDVDAKGVLFNKKGDFQGYTYISKNFKRYLIYENEQSLYDSLKQLFRKKQVAIISRSDNDDVLVVETTSNKDSGSFYIITNKSKPKKIGERLPFIPKSKLSNVKYVTYIARDGMKIKAYITLPKGKAPYPAIVLPHGGPWARDTIVFDEWSQMLAMQGYAVIQPNYRGSTGYGLKHWMAGDKNWGLKMQDDLDDAALYLVKEGVAKKDKLAMFGWSYGGYAAFIASMRKDNLYQCVVAGAGESDLSRVSAKLNQNRFLSNLQKNTIKGISPLSQVDKVNIPILIIHGDKDNRVSIKHSRQFVEKLKEYKKNYKYVELKNAEHFYDRLSYRNKQVIYNELLKWFDNQCHLKD